MMPARFADGVTARVRPAYVTLGPDHLQIHTRDGPQDPWPAPALRRLPAAASDDPLILTAADRPDARLEISDPDARRTVLAAFPQLARRSADWRVLGSVLRWAVGAAAAVLAVYLGMPWVATLAAPHIPLAWQANLGERAEAEVIAALTRGRSGDAQCRGRNGRAVLDGLVGRLAGAARIPAPRVIVVRSGIVNAFALPGNRVIVTAPLLVRLRSADSLAGVLAHEMGHLIHADWLRKFFQQAGWDALGAVAVGGSSLGHVGTTALTLSYSREIEREADASAVQTLIAADLDTRGFEGFMRDMAAEHQNDGGFWVTHPADAERAEAVRRAGRAGHPALTGEQWDILQRICNEPS